MRGRLISTIAILGLTAALAVSFSGCSNDDETGVQTGTIRVRMTDAPSQFNQVNLVITQVAVFRGPGAPADSDSVSGWTVIRTSPVNVDLMTLRNGIFLDLASAKVVTGTYTRLRLKLGAGSTVVVDGTTYPLFVPSGAQSGLKINGPFTVGANGISDILVDFDAARSIHQTGAGQYILNPVIRAVQSGSSGSITGHVLPDSIETTVFAIQASDTVTSTTTATNGLFTLSALSAGTYSVAFHPEEGAYRDTTVTGVVVTPNHVTTMANLTLTPQ